ncbi:MAG: dihydrofolate reductase [Bacteroidetes bacterium]|nr:dihydrofolate reductase [Bacteroidota bacterium]MBK9523888.1 dihydrofolate reductase [Bacteroidota bacterium]MBK9541629.1 dihydrofolate reductase [Bacteroidota bacterium]MBP6403071.1 dihydrofolate reductase [Bacteroidia bacterium]MBP6649228.1 dihydrofolate reductase [Bacteroidia bacterium]
MNTQTLKGLIILTFAFGLFGFQPKEPGLEIQTTTEPGFNYMADRFADIQVLRYKVDGFDELSLQQKELAYYLYQAGLCGRDIFYDQKYRYGLTVRKTLEGILQSYSGEKKGDQWDKFIIYCKRVFFANGIHHHYSSDKMFPECKQEYFADLLKKSDPKKLPLEGMALPEFSTFMLKIVFDPNTDPKQVDLSAGIDVIKASANNFYSGVTQAETEAYYDSLKKANPDDKSQIGFNTQLTKEDGILKERVWKENGMYGAAIKQIIPWLEKAEGVAENSAQKKSISTLIQFYKSGDPKLFDEHCIAWVNDTSARIDFVNGFIEVYQDALQKKGSFEGIVSMKDMVATKRIEAISKEAKWFEDHSTIMENHKKKNVKGITAKVITVIGEVGDAAPATPIGINLPNNDWIHKDHGSKSVSLGNIIEAYNFYKAKSPLLDEFVLSEEVKDRMRKYGAIANDLHVDMHEVIGHASGQINEGVGTTDQTLKNYAGILEEARADLVGLYFCMDKKLVDIGVSPSLDAGKAQYDLYVLNGLMTQLDRIELGKNLEEAHMRNRQLNSAWAFEKGAANKVIEKITRDGKTYLVINDYNKLRELFGQLLREIQRIKSEGDFAAGMELVEKYGVKVDPTLHAEVLRRYKNLNIAPYMGFIQAKLIPVMDGKKIKDVKVEYPESFLDQMLEYGKEYGYLPVKN